MELRGFFAEHYELLSGAIVCLFFLCAIAVKSYLTERGKLRAQIAENRKLVEQTETIKSRFSRELEELRKVHQLDISKRKYQYESKKEQYLKFFKLLDEFANDYNVKTQESFLPILDEFNRNYLNAVNSNNKRSEANAIAVFQKKVQKLMFDANQELIRIKQETNTIRIIASNAILQKLDLLTLAYDQAMETSNKMMKDLLPLMLSNNQQTMEEQQQEIELGARLINNIKDDIIKLMRIELDEI